jgi:hypothetical protein
MMYRLRSSILLSAALLASTLHAQPIEEHPGYFPIDELQFLSPDDLSLEINLRGAMLRLIGKVAAQDDPEFAQVMEHLEAIRVQTAPLDQLAAEEVRQGLDRGLKMLESMHWQRMVLTRDEGEEVHIYGRELDGDLQGLAVLAIEDDEVILINLVGRIDPDQLGRLMTGLDLPEVSVK